MQTAVCLAGLCWLSSSVKRFSQLAGLSQQGEVELYRLMENKFGEDVWSIVSVDRRVADLGIPALLFHDHDDLECSLQESEAISKAWQDSQLIMTEGLGHQMILRNKQVVRQTVNFIKQKSI